MVRLDFSFKGAPEDDYEYNSVHLDLTIDDVIDTFVEFARDKYNVKIDGTNNGVFEMLSDLLYEGGDFLEEMSEEDTAFGKYIHNKYMEDAREVWEEEKLLLNDEG